MFINKNCVRPVGRVKLTTCSQMSLGTFSPLLSQVYMRLVVHRFAKTSYVNTPRSVLYRKQQMEIFKIIDVSIPRLQLQMIKMLPASSCISNIANLHILLFTLQINN
jgi:hypothetical protein